MGFDFQVGDRVRYIADVSPICGATGTILAIEQYSIGICFDDDIGMHDLSGLCEKGHGFWTFINGHTIEKIEDDTPATEGALGSFTDMF